MSRLALLMFVFGVVIAPAVAADETYMLKLYKSKEGDVATSEKVKKDEATVAFDFNGMVRMEKISGGEKTKFVEKVVTKPAGAKKATTLERTYELAEKSTKGETTKLPFHGETVLIKKVDDKYEFSVNGKKLSATDAEELDKEFNKKEEGPANEDLLPTKPVKVGESWTVDNEKALKSLEADGKIEIDTKKSKITGKLLKAYKKGDAQYGVIEFTIDLKVKKMEFGGADKIDLEEGSNTKLILTVDTCIDGTVPSEKSEINMSLSLKAKLPNGTLSVEGKTTGTETVEGKKK